MGALKADANPAGWYQDYSQTLRRVLGLHGSPVAVAFSDRPAASGTRQKYRACGAASAARHGAVISLSRANSACRGATGNLGLGPLSPVEDFFICSFLAHSEKLWKTVPAAHRARRHTFKQAPPPCAHGQYLIFAPLEKAKVEPALVLFICNPEQACRLTSLARYHDGVLPPSQMEGSLCWSTITYPLATGNINVSLGDFTARRIEGWQPDELVVSVPTPKLHNIMESMDSCTAGTASPLIRLRMSPGRGEAITSREAPGRPPA